ncbi:MAG TPA: hypothetical protein VGH32_08925 [Pirellulales bacterium]
MPRSSSGPLPASVVLAVAAALFLVSPRTGAADDDHVVKGEAPPDYAVLAHARGGAFFVPKDLMERHDQLLARVARIKADLAAGKIKADAALSELKEIDPLLDGVRKELQEKKVLVSPVKVQKQTEELLFDFGPERMLIVTADHLRVVGWDGPKVKCVLEKSLFATSDKPEMEEFKALRLTHGLGPAPELVGKAPEAVSEEEKKFVAEHANQPLSESQLAARRQLVSQIQGSYAPYRAFQGKEVDVVGIEGLSGQQGNRQVTVDIRSKGGGGAMGSDWRRQAMLTVYVPRSNGVLLRGCLVGLDIDGVKGPLYVTDADSLDRDYDGAFRIKNLDGPLTMFNVPLDRLEQVHGDVKIVATVEYANTGTHYENDQRTTIIPPPRECAIDAIEGNFTAWFSRVNLKIGGVSGMIDVKNEVGDTRFAPAAPIADRAHRLVSTSGNIDVRLKRSQLDKLPIMALTNEGTVKTNAKREVLDETNFTTGNAADGSRRDWRGLKTPKKRDAGLMFDQFERPAAVLRDAERSPGLDIITQSGTIDLTIER